MSRNRIRKWHELHDNGYFREYCNSVDTAAVLADLPERYSVSVPPVTNNIYNLRASDTCPAVTVPSPFIAKWSIIPNWS